MPPRDVVRCYENSLIKLPRRNEFCGAAQVRPWRFRVRHVLDLVLTTCSIARTARLPTN